MAGESICQPDIGQPVIYEGSRFSIAIPSNPHFSITDDTIDYAKHTVDQAFRVTVVSADNRVARGNSGIRT